MPLLFYYEDITREDFKAAYCEFTN